MQYSQNIGTREKQEETITHCWDFLKYYRFGFTSAFLSYLNITRSPMPILRRAPESLLGLPRPLLDSLQSVMFYKTLKKGKNNLSK